MIFESNSSIDGPYEFGYEAGWHWSRSKGSYDTGTDFFWVHWEISDSSPSHVKLHVESPNAATDLALNAIKQEVVKALIASGLQSSLKRHGYKCVVGSKAKPGFIAQHKSTQAFRIDLIEEQRQSTHQANIEMVNGVAGKFIREVLQRFATRINPHFPT